MAAIDALKRHYPEAIALMPDQFDSHDLIDKLMALHPTLYVAFLDEFASQGRKSVPLAHGALSKALYDFPELVRRDGDAVSINVRGHQSKAAAWRKVE